MNGPATETAFAAKRTPSPTAAFSSGDKRLRAPRQVCLQTLALRVGPATISELAGVHALTINGVKKHVGVLERADLVVTEKVGRSRHCRLGSAGLGDAVEWIEGYRQAWEGRLDRFELRRADLGSRGVSRELRFERRLAAPPERVFDAFTAPAGLREFYGKDEPGWIVESEWDLRVGGVWSISFGPSPNELYHHRHVFEAIERPRRILIASTETRLDGFSFETAIEFTFEPDRESTLMTMTQSGFPSEELRYEHTLGLPHAFDRLERELVPKARLALQRGDPMSNSVLDMSMSLDGFIAGPGDDAEHGLEVIGEVLHAWLGEWEGDGPSGFRPAGAGATVYGDLMATGAVVVGRRTFDLAEQWGGDHHGVPIFVPTRGRPPEPASALVHYVTDGVESAMRQAKKAAGEANVMVHGAELAQSLLRAGVLDELEIHLVPVLLGEGRRLFEHLGVEQADLELTRVLESTGVVHLHYRVR